MLLEVYFQGQFLEAGVLGWRVNARVTFLDIVKFLSIVVELFCIFLILTSIACIRVAVSPQTCQNVYC